MRRKCRNGGVVTFGRLFVGSSKIDDFRARDDAIRFAGSMGPRFKSLEFRKVDLDRAEMFQTNHTYALLFDRRESMLEERTRRRIGHNRSRPREREERFGNGTM